MEKQELNLEKVRAILKGRTEITLKDVGHYVTLQVSSVLENTNEETRERAPYIVNFKAFTSYHTKQMRELIAEGELQDAMNCTLSKGIRLSDYKPQKGERVKVFIESYTNSKGIDNCIGVAEIVPLESKVASKGNFDIDAILGEAAVAGKKASRKLEA